MTRHRQTPSAMRAVLFAFAVGVLSLNASVIPDARRIAWSPGVPGGIPTSYTTNTILAPSGSDDTSRIQSALYAAAWGSKVVVLSNGTWTVNGQLTFPSQVILRGVGSNTVVNVNNSGNVAAFSIYQSPGYGFQADLLYTNALPKGCSNLVSRVNSGTLFVGSCIQIQQNNSSSVVTGLEGDSGQWAQGQWVVITAKNGTNITFWPPLHTAYDTSLAPRIRYPAWTDSGNMVRGSGLENMKIVNLNASAQSIIDIHLAYKCWVKGVELVNAAGRHIWLHDTFQCEIRDSYIHGALAPITSSRGYGIELGDPSSGLPCTKTTDLLIENNIFSLCRGDVIVGNGASGCVIGYNFHLPGTNETSTIQSVSLSVHSDYPLMNLFEGNVCYYVNADIFHGSGDTSTLFRNQIFGKAPGKLSQITCIQLDAYQRNANIVGNVLGYPNLVSDVATTGGTSVYLRKTPEQSISSEFKVLMFGYDGSGGGHSRNDTNVFNSVLLTGNYDYVQNTTTWDTSGVQILPASLYLTTRPTWWPATTPWPAIGPDVTNLVNPIPAQVRYAAMQNGNPDPITLRLASPTPGVQQ